MRKILVGVMFLHVHPDTIEEMLISHLFQNNWSYSVHLMGMLGRRISKWLFKKKKPEL